MGKLIVNGLDKLLKKYGPEEKMDPKKNAKIITEINEYMEGVRLESIYKQGMSIIDAQGIILD